MTSKGRTAVLALLVTVIGVRVSVSQPLNASVARIASDPGAAVRHAADGWTATGTLGGASAQGLRDVPLALYYWLGSQLGLSAQVLQTSWRVLVLLLALGGAIRLARALATPEWADTWMPWVAAALYSTGIVLVPTLVRSPLDGLAAATLPWIVAPLLAGRVGWRGAAMSAAWLGLAGVGSFSWAAAAVVAGLVAAIPRSRQEVAGALRWLVLAAVSCAWWVSAFAWEARHGHDMSALLHAEDLRGAVADAVGRPDLAIPLVLLVTLGPVVVTLSTLLLRPAGADLVFVAGLSGAALVLGAAWLGGWDLPVFASAAADRPASVLAPVLGWLALAALVSWTPLVGLFGHRLRHVALWPPPSGRRELTAGLLAALVVLTTAAGAMAAAAEPQLTDEGRPGLETQVATWSRKAAPGRVLVMPPRSEAATAPSLGAALGDRPWVGRDSAPASGTSGTSALDDLLDRLGRGDGGPGTSSALRRLGISYVLLHLDGSVSADRANPSALVRAALVAQGARRVAHLSGAKEPEVEAETPRLLDFGVRGTSELVEIWSLPAAAFGRVHEGDLVDVVGDPGSTSDLVDAGALDTGATRLLGESGRGADVLSDSARRRDVDQRVPVHPYGPDLGADERRSVVPADAAPVTTAHRRVTGARSVSASSSAADLDGVERRAGSDALAAVDANLFTSWQSRRGSTTGEWWEIELDAPTQLSGASVQFVRNLFAGRPVTRVEVRTDEGSQEYDVAADGLLELPRSEETTRLRITVIGVQGTAGASDSVGIAEVRIPDVTVQDELVVAGPRARAWLLAARPGSFAHCVPAAPTANATPTGDPTTVCDRGVAVEGPDTGRLDRILRVDEAAVVTGRAWVRAADTEQSGALARRLARPSVVAAGSSVAAQDLVTRPQAAADADTSTAWRPAPEDSEPTLTLSWPGAADVSGLRLDLGDEDVASRPTLVRVTAEVPGKAPATAEAEVGPDGTVTFPTMRTRSLTITFLEDSGLTSVGSLTGGTRPAPIAVAEVGILGGPRVRYDGARVRELGCGSGPVVSIGDKGVWTAVTTSARDVVAGVPVLARFCDEVGLRPGEVEVGIAASYSWLPMGVLLTTDESTLAETPRADGESSSDGETTISPAQARAGIRGTVAVDLESSTAERTAVLAVPAGSGWVARGSEGALQPLTVDGWAQAWSVPAGVERVELRYSAGGVLRGWVGFTAVGWVLVVLLAVSGAATRGVRSRGSR